MSEPRIAAMIVDLVLASSSPRRRAILERIGLTFEVVEPLIGEEQNPGELPVAYAERLALEKAMAVARQLKEGRCETPWVLGADTIVVLDGKILGKPADIAEAHETISALSGRAHEVMTGWAIVNLAMNQAVSSVETTKVFFKELSDAEIHGYAATGEGLDKAGAYGIQGLGCVLVSRIEGNYENVVGLPTTPIVTALTKFGVISSFPFRGDLIP